MKRKFAYLLKLGKAVHHARVSSGFTQEELAEIAGLHRTYIGGIERGERNVTIENILRISKALQVSCASLVEDIEHLDLE